MRVIERVPTGVVCGPSMTKQSFKEETDINYIVRKYQKTGMLSFVSDIAPQFMEVDSLEYQDALNLVIQAQNAFDQMPSNLRKRFENDPAKFLQFTEDQNNLEEMYDLGLATRPVLEEAKPDNTPPVETPPA